ncbi:MAG: hypothetical protein OXC05_08285 [Halieaceae bacterium]|nr:hypothetical protein [Halieaceae bacterium]
MNTSKFEIEQFAELLDSHGAEPARWPETLRSRALMLVAAEPAAQSLLQEAHRLEAALNALPAPAAPIGLKSRIIARLPSVTPIFLPDRMLDWLTTALWRPLLLASLPLAFGFTLGVGVYQDTGEPEDSLALLVFSDAAAVTFGEVADYEQ